MKYYIPEYGDTADDAEEIEVEGAGPGGLTVGEFAEIAADHVYHNRDGWDSKWPIVFRVIDDAGTDHRVVVEMEGVPTFYAQTPEPEPPTNPEGP